MLYKVNIGDWSDDGHGKFETYVVDVDCSSETLKDNFDRAVKELGFSPFDIARGYEDNSMTIDQFDRLEDAGYSFDSRMEPDKYYYFIDGPEEMLEIIMFFVSYGSDEVIWRIISEDIPILAGGYGAVVGRSNHIGYGLFY